MRIKVIRIEQPIGFFYIGKMQAEDLLQLAKADIADMNKYTDIDDEEFYIGGQRQLIKRKVEQIKRYVRTSGATFPASIILNLNKKYLVKESDDELIIEDNENAFQLIDGQHRLSGLEGLGRPFEMPISIFVGLDEAKTSRIFTTINTTQTKVNPSLSLYLEANDPVWTPRTMVVKVANFFATDVKSPLYKKIKFNIQNDIVDNSESTISLQTFGKAILDMVYDDNYFYEVRDISERDELGLIDKSNFKADILWPYYVEHKENALYKVLYNYFSSISTIFSPEWKDKKAILVKTTGYNAFMKLFRELYEIGYEEGDLSKEFFERYLCKASGMSGTFNTNYYGGSGWQPTNELYAELKKRILE
ncbi:DGQHR domain-containing protein [Pseudobutyrivibrio sp. AR14]|uniref:DGQHR domain-containing protein n=1 Tax=Pseudobutyrivibrio sp. AR14 TaxID=1520804 RepID=UPI000883FC62|nr:DGQHR domain-containing protein [Pseudobutyrivibrio sp. AR14]SCY45866.1 DGQHR domain-containing protein [Pseudobutyrivibrio sp. AR14]